MAPSADEGGHGAYSAAVLLLSIILHGLILLAFILMHDGAPAPDIIPLDVIVLDDETISPPQSDASSTPQPSADTPSPPAAEPTSGVAPNERLDELDSKLHALSKLQQPNTDDRALETSRGLPRVAAGSNDGAADSYTARALKDLIRAQVERRWGLDLSTLGGSNFSVLIRVEITRAGVVTKAEVADTVRFNTDKTYHDIALSARNAVLLSSPFVLPPASYSDVMDLVLNLNTKDARR